MKELLNFSQIKYAALSHAIGYDLSYVSKWTTGIRLPAAKNVDRINQEIARFLSEIIIKQDNLEAFAQHFLGRASIEQENVAFEIYQSLSCAYRNSLECKKEKHSAFPKTIFSPTIISDEVIPFLQSKELRYALLRH